MSFPAANPTAKNGHTLILTSYLCFISRRTPANLLIDLSKAPTVVCYWTAMVDVRDQYKQQLSRVSFNSDHSYPWTGMKNVWETNRNGREHVSHGNDARINACILWPRFSACVCSWTSNDKLWGFKIELNSQGFGDLVQPVGETPKSILKILKVSSFFSLSHKVRVESHWRVTH